MGKHSKARIAATGLNNLGSAWQTLQDMPPRPERKKVPPRQPRPPVRSTPETASPTPEPASNTDVSGSAIDQPQVSDSTLALLDRSIDQIFFRHDLARSQDTMEFLNADIQNRLTRLHEDSSLWAPLKTGGEFSPRRRQQIVYEHFGDNPKYALTTVLSKLSDHGQRVFTEEAKIIRKLNSRYQALWDAAPDYVFELSSATTVTHNDPVPSNQAPIPTETTGLVSITPAVNKVVKLADDKDAERRAMRRARVATAAAGTTVGPTGVVHELPGRSAVIESSVTPAEADESSVAAQVEAEDDTEEAILGIQAIFIELERAAEQGFKTAAEIAAARLRLVEIMALITAEEARVYAEYKEKTLTKVDKERLIALTRDARRLRHTWLDRLRRAETALEAANQINDEVEELPDENIEALEDEPSPEQVVTDEQLVSGTESPVINPSSDAGITLVPAPESGTGATPQPIQQPVGFVKRVSQSWSNALDYIRNGWRRVYREEVLGELAPYELESAVEVGHVEAKVQAAAGIAGGLASGLGVAFIPDITRWATQTLAAKADREVINQAIREAVRARSELLDAQVEPSSIDALDFADRVLEHRERQQHLIDQVQANRRLTPSQKELLLSKLQLVLEDFEHNGAGVQAAYDQEVAASLDAALTEAQATAERLVNTHLISKVSGGKVMREAVNTAAVLGSGAAIMSGAATVFAGLHLARGPAYSLQSIVERYTQASQEQARGERKSEVTVLKVVKEGFADWWKKLSGEQQSYRDRRQALGTLVRSLGLGGATLAAGGELLSEAMENTDLDKVLERGLARAKNTVSEVYQQWFGEDELGVVPDLDEGRVFKGEIPVGSRVLGGSEHEGITYVLKRVIQNNPEAYGYDGDSDLSADIFAKRLAVRIAEGDGQMRRWLTSKAIDKLNLFPEFINGEWHLAAVVDGRKLTLEDLAEQGFTSAMPDNNK